MPQFAAYNLELHTDTELNETEIEHDFASPKFCR